MAKEISNRGKTVTAGLLLVAGTFLTFFVNDKTWVARREIAKRLAAA